MFKISFSALILLSLADCKSFSKNDSKEPIHVETKGISKEPIHLYRVAPIFNDYMPDTSLKFANPKALSQYFFLTLKKFKDICDKISSTSKNKDSIKVEIKQAEILYQDLTEVNYMKFYKIWKKDNVNMSMLSSFSPNSRIISLQERKDFFKTFPTEIQNNEVGKKTWEKFEEYSFDRNINVDINRFNKISLVDTNNRKEILEQNFKQLHKYYIIVFGASWCLPCRVDELQLKQWYSNLDTAQIKIVGLSIDRDFRKWKKYVVEDKLPWDCYILQGEMNNDMIKELQFESVPRNFLIDSTGKIIAENTDIRKILQQIPILISD